MKKAMLVLMFVFAVAGLVMAQNWSSTVDVLGAHNNGGRGCAGCHAPHSGSFGSGHGGVSDAGSYALWGQDASPLYGATIKFGEGQVRHVSRHGIGQSIGDEISRQRHAPAIPGERENQQTNHARRDQTTVKLRAKPDAFFRCKLREEGIGFCAAGKLARSTIRK